MRNKYNDETDDKLPLSLTETVKGMFMASNIYDGADDFFSTDVAAAYEYDDGRADNYPLDRANPTKFS